MIDRQWRALALSIDQEQSILARSDLSFRAPSVGIDHD
jgi:hypothetical protein